MNETLGCGYARIEAIRTARGEPLSNMANPSAPPPDHYNMVYLTLFCAGAAFLLPFNSFIMAVDYFQYHYPQSTIMFDMSTVYIASACVAVVINNLLLDVFSYNTRITFGILVSLATMLFVAICNIGWDGFSTSVSYTINLVAISVVAFGCTVQQASYYGFSGCLPPRYTQAVMAGESAAGFWVSLDRIMTKQMFSTPTRSTFMFFLFSILLLLVHSMLHHMTMRHPLVQHYLKITTESKQKRKIQLHLNPNEDATLMESEVGEPSYGVLQIQSPALSTTAPADNAFSFANPVYSPHASSLTALSEPPGSPSITSPRPSYKVEDVVFEPPDIPTSWRAIKRSPSPADNAFSFANPVYSPHASSLTALSEPPGSPSITSPRPSYKVEDVVFEPPDRPTSWRAIKRGILDRWAVARAIYPYMVSIGLVYFATLALYPGIASEVQSCELGTWMPIVLMTFFNMFDFIGKIAAAWPYDWSRSQLLMASGVRLLLVPLLLLCAAPRYSPHIVGDVYPIMFSVILGFTNGLFGSVPMIMAPSRVSREHREIAGNMMTLSYNGGLLSGSLVSYLLLSMLGDPPGNNPCKTYPMLVLQTLPPPITLPPVTLPPNITFVMASH